MGHLLGKRGWRLYNIKDRKFFISRDVFEETKFLVHMEKMEIGNKSTHFTLHHISVDSGDDSVGSNIDF